MATTEPLDEIAALKLKHRATWAAGDYATVAEGIATVGERIVRHVAVRSGDHVLDVACGTGNAAIPAALAGGDVIGVDLTTELLDTARKLAAAAGVGVKWREGDAEALPFADARFDVVLSTFGCMFAPRHELAARELDRVLRPGGRLGLCNWTPDGIIGGFFATVSGHLPAPPPFTSPPPLWGDEEYVRSLFDGTGIGVDFSREIVELTFDSVDDQLAFYATHFGPVVKARELLEPRGRWESLRDDLWEYFDRTTERRAGGVMWPCEYLVVRGLKAGGPGQPAQASS